MVSRSRALLAPIALISAAAMLAGCGPERPEAPVAPVPPGEAASRIQSLAAERGMPLRVRENLVAQLRGPARGEPAAMKQAARGGRGAGRSTTVAE